jgi:hypothetical protein
MCLAVRANAALQVHKRERRLMELLLPLRLRARLFRLHLKFRELATLEGHRRSTLS